MKGLKTFRVTRMNEGPCDWCGYPLYAGDSAIIHWLSDRVTCGLHCAHLARDAQQERDRRHDNLPEPLQYV